MGIARQGGIQHNYDTRHTQTDIMIVAFVVLVLALNLKLTSYTFALGNVGLFVALYLGVCQRGSAAHQTELPRLWMRDSSRLESSYALYTHFSQ